MEKFALESLFPKLSTFLKSVESLSRNLNPNLAINQHICAICARLEEACDAIFGYDVNPSQG